MDRAAPIPLGAFDLLTCVGRGGMGQVWRSLHRRSGQTVAIKILDAEVAQKSGFASAFRDEARVVAGLTHPHIVSVFDLGEVSGAEAEAVAGTGLGAGAALLEGSPYLVMEFAHQGTVESVLTRLSWPELEEILQGLLGALAHAHARGVVHLDVKPANLLLGCGGISGLGGMRLTDFGLSWQERSPGRAARRAELGGTLGRMAPEQIQATWREYGPWTDLYAVGAMVWQYATGSKPFGGSTRAAQLVGPLTRDLPPLIPVRPVPPGLEAWLRVLMAREPSGRFPLCADAALALRELSGRPLRSGGLREERGLGGAGASSSIPPDAPTVLQGELSLPPTRLGEGPGRWGQVALAADAVTEGWRLAHAEPSPSALGDVGLGLFGLRAVPFVGREAERDRLWAALSRARSRGRAEVVLVRGPAGVGKSRLAEWLGQRALEVGAAGVFLRAEHPSAEADPHAGLRPALARLLGCVELPLPAAAAHLERVLSWWGPAEDWLAPSLARWLLPEAPAPAEPPEVLLSAVLQVLSRHRPVILWLDDIQWGLEALDALRHLLQAQTVAPLPLVVVLTASEEALVEQPEATALLAALGGGVTVVELGPLEPPEDELLVRALTGLEPARAALLAEQVAGNPLLAVHIVGEWIARGVLVPGPGGLLLQRGAEAGLPGEAQLPAQLRALWQRRLQRLADRFGGPALEALELAALMGAEVHPSEWRALLRGWEPEPLTDALLRARLARPSPRGWSFVHAMLREVLAEQARQSGRWSQHHRACASLLAAASTPALQERLGHHLLCAGEPRLAFAHLMAAARAFDQQGISRAASRVIVRAEEALDALLASPQDRRRCACRLLMALIEIRRHHPRRWLEELRRWQHVAHRQGWSDLEVEALWIRGEALQKSDALDEAGACLQEGLQRAQALDLPRLQQEIRAGLALLRLRRGDQVGAAPLLEEILQHPPLPDAPTVQLMARLNLASIARIHGNLEVAERHAEAAILQGRAGGCLDVVAHGLLVLGAIADQRGELSLAAAHLRESLDIVRRTSKFRAISLTWNSLGEVSRRQGDWNEAEICYRTSLAWAEASGRPVEAPQINLALLLARRGRYAESRAMLGVVLQRVASLGDSFTAWHCRAFLLPALAGLGEWVAFDQTLQAVQIEEEAGSGGRPRFNQDIAEEATFAGELALAAREPMRAAAVWRLALEHWQGLQREPAALALAARLAALPP